MTKIDAKNIVPSVISFHVILHPFNRFLGALNTFYNHRSLGNKSNAFLSLIGHFPRLTGPADLECYVKKSDDKAIYASL